MLLLTVHPAGTMEQFYREAAGMAERFSRSMMERLFSAYGVEPRGEPPEAD